ncbi:DUF1800 family protein [Mycobacterium sp. ZZG]
MSKRRDTGAKKVLGVVGDLDADGFCDAVLSHPNSARFIAGRLWQQLAADSHLPPKATMDRLLRAYGPDMNLGALTKAVLTDPHFHKPSSTVIIGPVEWLIGLHRTVRVPIDTEKKVKRTVSVLKSLGQLPFYPPSVGGWPGGQTWLSAAAAGIRLRTAARVIDDDGDISVVAEAGTSDRLDAVGYLLGVGHWSNSTAKALKPLSKDPSSLVAAAVNSPEYLVS